MDGMELYKALNYQGMVRAARKLALEDKLVSAEELAVMPEDEVCELLAKNYEMLYAESEEVGLVRREDLQVVNKKLKRLSR